MTFFAEAVISGLLTGVMYSLVALGFVLIYKASGVFNFAQGVMALFAALTLVGLMNEYKLSVWAAIPLTIAVMIALAFFVERFILRYLVNQEPIVLFMATLGLAYGLEGLGDIIWGPDVKVLDIGLPQGANNWLLDHFDIFVDQLEIVAAATAAILVAVLAIFFQRLELAERCVRLRTTTRRRCRSASRCRRSGSLFGRSQGSWRWLRASCGARNPACNFPCR